MAREILTDEQWDRIRPLLPPQRPKTGRPAKDHRTVVEAILWIDRTGAPWRDLPQEFGPWQSIATRFYRWVEAGVWDHVLAELQRQADAEGDLDWNLHHIDGSSIRAHQHAAGAKKGEALTTHQRRQRKIRRQRRPSGEAEADSRPRSTFAPRATANPSPS
jgi:transposase